jgi:hypothetical protein
MKTLKFVLIAAILSLGTMSFTIEDPGPFSSAPDQLAVKISLRAAMQNHGLVVAMHSQLDRSFLQSDQNGPYMVQVNYKRVSYFVFGSYEEWRAFFSVSIGNNDPPIE